MGALIRAGIVYICGKLMLTSFAKSVVACSVLPVDKNKYNLFQDQNTKYFMETVFINSLVASTVFKKIRT